MSTIRTDSRSNAINDLSDARIAGETLPAYVDLDDDERLDVVETSPGQWQVESPVNGRAYPI